MLRIVHCPQCRDLEDRVAYLEHKLAQERDKRITARLVDLTARRKTRREPTLTEALQALERALTQHIRTIPPRQREWRVPGNQDLRAVQAAITSVVGLEGLQAAQRTEFLQALSRELDHHYPGNILSGCLETGKVAELTAQVQEG